LSNKDYTEFRVRAADKRVYGGKTDVNQVLPFRYRKAWELYLRANANHWMPSANDFDQELRGRKYEDMLTPLQYLIVELGVAWHSIVSQISLELIPVIYRHTTAPECRLFLLRMLEEDNISLMLVTKFIPLTNLQQPAIQNWITDLACGLLESVHAHLECKDLHDYTALVSFLAVLKTYGSRGHYAAFLGDTGKLAPQLGKYVAWLKRDLDNQCDFMLLLISNLVKENPGIATFAGMALNSWANASSLHWDGHDLSKHLSPHQRKFPQELKAMTSSATVKASADNTNLSWD